MIGVTSFFRDRAVFHALGHRMRHLHDQRGRLNVLSVGCSDGSELYSTAMLLAEGGMLSTSRLRGIDCRPDAIEKARAGIYRADTLAEVPKALAERYFEPADVQERLSRRLSRATSAVRVVRAVREACEWAVADGFALSQQTFDVVLCRNVAIYLTMDSAAQLWSTLASRLSPGGLLVVGKAERPPSTVRAECARVSRCIYQKQGGFS